MTRLIWCNGEQVASRCPVCGEPGSKNSVLRALDFSTDKEAPQELVLLSCPTCQAKFFAPGFLSSHEGSGGIQFYLEQGAGIDTMLQPLKLLDGRPVHRMIEIGCGFGFLMHYAREILGWEVIGYDPGGAAAMGRRQLRLPIENRPFNGLDAGDKEYDLVYCSEVIEHIPEPLPFLANVRAALHEQGMLVLTTPNADIIKSGMGPELMMVLSPGSHVVLYNERTLRQLLAEGGFPHLRVSASGHQIVACASSQPFAGTRTYFDRALYRRYIELAAEQQRPSTPLGLGLRYRFFKELVNSGEYKAAEREYERLRAAIIQCYGIDPNEADKLDFSVSVAAPLRRFGSTYPFNLCGICYGLGLIQLLRQQEHAQAARSFTAAIKSGQAIRAALQRIGADDLETAQLCCAAELALLSALVQFDPPAALHALERVQENANQLNQPAFTEHLRSARQRLFTDFVNLGHFEGAEALLPALDQRVDADATDERSPAGRAVLLAKGKYWAHHKGAYRQALECFERVLAGFHTAGTANDAMSEADLSLCREAETGRMRMLARVAPSRMSKALRSLSKSTSEKSAASSTALRQAAYDAAVTELVNLGRLNAARFLLAAEGRESFEQVSPERLEPSLAYGIYLLNRETDYMKAREIFSRVYEFAAASPPADANLLWCARFHEGLAAAYLGDSEGAGMVARQVISGSAMLPPVPQHYRDRVSELVKNPTMLAEELA